MIERFKIMIRHKKYIFLFFALFLIVLNQRFLNSHQDGLANSIFSDGTGYYSYLPAAIIYQDFDYNFFGKKENKIKPCYYYYADDYNGEKLNKYYCGTAICLLPFFIIGIIISALAGTDVNGYTDTFLMLVSIAGIVYFLFSVWLIGRIALFFRIHEKISFFVCILFFLSTNLFHYVVQEPSMSHVYSFFAVSFSFYLFTRLIETKSNSALRLFFMSLALVALIRPTNLCIVFFLPFFFSDFRSFFEFSKIMFTEKTKTLIASILLFIFTFSIQFVLYYIQTGDFFIVPYQNESFDFSKPELFNILFSYRKGLFLYTPFILVALVSIFISNILWNKKLSLLVTLTVFTYIASSWWCWWYGGSFGNRTFIDIYPLILITFIILFNGISVNYKKLLIVLCLPIVFGNQIMAFQYNRSIIHTDQMNKELYWDIFLNPDLESINERKHANLIAKYKVYKSGSEDFNNKNLSDRVVTGGYKNRKACVVGETNYYSESIELSLEEDLNINESFYVFAEMFVRQDEKSKDLGLVVSLEVNGNIILWDGKQCNLFNEQSDGWKKVSIYKYIDKSLIAKGCIIKIYAMSSQGRSLVDHTSYEIIKAKSICEY